MELQTKSIHTGTIKPGITMQITLDDDYNVPDSKPDVERLILERGEVEISDTEALNGKIRVSGICHFYVLACTNLDAYPISTLNGTIPFEQIINCDGVLPNTSVKVKAILEDLTISIINSRKLSIRALITLKSTLSISSDLTAAVAVSDTSSNDAMQSPDLQCLYQTLDMTTLCCNKKDILRIKEELTIPSGKPELYEILWNQVTLNNYDLRLGDGVIHISGECNLFTLYNTEESNDSVQYVEMNLPFQGDLICEECTESMIECIDIQIGTTNISVKANQAGAMRNLDLECTLDLDIRLYEEEHCEFLLDCYAPNADCSLEKHPFYYNQLLQKNSAKTRVTRRMKLKDAQDSILQFCHIDGTVKLDDMVVAKDGVELDGVISTNLLYLTASDSTPLGSSDVLVPFHYFVELEGLQESDHYEISAHLDQISINMVDSDEVEIKAILSIYAIAFRSGQANLIQSIETMPLDSEKMQKQPGMVGYIVKSGDTLWNIAKTYYTTVDTIKECNELEIDDIHEGDKLLIVK